MLRIIHVCISCPYIDNWGYQENLLPQYLQKEGTENIVICSINNFPAYLSKDKISEINAKGNEYLINGVQILRIPTIHPRDSWGIAPSLFSTIQKIKPDIIFHHGVNFSTLLPVFRYSRKESIPVFVDNHADVINMSKNVAWNFIYHKGLNRVVCHIFKNQVVKYYGVTPLRCQFLECFYQLPKSIIDLLPIGADTDEVSTIPSKTELRLKYDFTLDANIIVSGGKMGVEKGTDKIINAVKDTNYHLVLFGEFLDDHTRILAESSNNVSIFGWCDRKQSLELLKMADVACWPVHHTTLIEDAISVCTPILIKNTDNTSHLIIGNGSFCDVSNLESAINQFFSSSNADILVHAISMRNTLDYHSLAKKVLRDYSDFYKNIKHGHNCHS